MTTSDVNRKCLCCCGLVIGCWRKKSPKCENERQEVNSLGYMENMDLDMQQTEYCNVDIGKNEFIQAEEAVYMEVPREGLFEPKNLCTFTEEVMSAMTTSTNTEYVECNIVFDRAQQPSALGQSVKEKQTKVNSDETSESGGVLYVDLRQSFGGSQSMSRRPMYKRCEYAAIDHNLKPMPAPPLLNINRLPTPPKPLRR